VNCLKHRCWEGNDRLAHMVVLSCSIYGSNCLFSGLEVRDRLWLKISIPHAFIGKDKKLPYVREQSFMSALAYSLYNCFGTKKTAEKVFIFTLQSADRR
jgi:hypothetical protein